MSTKQTLKRPYWCKDRRHRWHILVKKVGETENGATIAMAGCNREFEIKKVKRSQPATGVFCRECHRKA